MKRPRVGHGAILLTNGDVLVFGGVTLGFGVETEIYHPATGTWSDGPSMNETRAYTSLVHLQDGRWLVGGGLSRPYSFRATLSLASVETFEE
jgi:hypothetical protein